MLAGSGFLVPVSGAAAGAQHPPMPQGMTHEEHLRQMNARADAAMGFDQARAAHHFMLTENGGIIRVEAIDPADAATRDEVRAHLRAIAQAFGDGVFEKPLETHGEMPPGVAALQRLKSSIAYTSEETARGALVRIVTSDREALAAVHEFLRYQIREHATGDPLAVSRARGM